MKFIDSKRELVLANLIHVINIPGHKESVKIFLSDYDSCLLILYENIYYCFTWLEVAMFLLKHCPGNNILDKELCDYFRYLRSCENI